MTGSEPGRPARFIASWLGRLGVVARLAGQGGVADGLACTPDVEARDGRLGRLKVADQIPAAWQERARRDRLLRVGKPVARRQ